MVLPVPSLIERREYEVKRLLTNTPPQFRHEHKRAIVEHLKLERSGSTLRYSRWQPGALPLQLLNHQPVISIKPSVYDYAGPSEGVWHVNFADPDLFVAYAGRLLAQDELQVIEHPSLAALKEALVAEGLPAFTETESGPTPVLITGIERLGHLNTQPTIERPQGLYGNEFARAPLAEVLSALTLNSPRP